MFCKLVLLSVVSLALAKPQHLPAAQYPAGVNPQDCPGFPICDNARLHNKQSHWGAPAPAPAWQPQPQQHWGGSAPSWQPEPSWNAPAPSHWGAPAPAWQPAPAHGSAGGDKFPAGVNPHTCPNYPFCDVNAGHHGHAVAAPPLPGWTERLYPAGVSPHECPNFPYCH